MIYSHISINDWLKYIENKLPELGYSIIEPILVEYCGGEILSDEYINESGSDSEDDYIDYDTIIWKNLIGEDLFNKSIEHNKKVESNLYDNID